MKKLICLFICLVFASVSHASPFLVCDPQTDVDEYVIEINGTEHVTPAPMHYDLAGLQEGDYTVRAKARNMWGDSGWSTTLTFTKSVPAAPTGCKVSRN